MENKKLGLILKDKKFLKSIMKMETSEEVQKAFEEKGFDFSKEEILSMGDVINKTIEKGITLSEEELDTISGGTISFGMLKKLKEASNSMCDLMSFDFDDSQDEESIVIIRKKNKPAGTKKLENIKAFVAGFGTAVVTASAVKAVVKWAHKKKD